MQCTSLRSLLPPKTKILITRIYFTEKKLTLTTNMIYTQENVHMYHTCLKGLMSLHHMHPWLASDPFELSQQFHLQKASFFFLDIPNAFQNTISHHLEKRFHLSLTYLFMGWYKIKWPKHTLASRNQK